MKIASVIADLLFAHECIVIPGLGGFITKNHPASVHPVKDQFKPPYKEIVFNPYLRANDGLLLNYIVQQENIPYSDAKAKLDRFVLKCFNEMDKGNKISFRNIGRIYYDANKQVVFQADESQNYLAESFGLTDFVSPAIKREGIQEKIERTIHQREETKQQTVESENKSDNQKAEPKKVKSNKKNVLSSQDGKLKRTGKSTIKTQIWVVALLVVGLLVAWGFINKDTVNDYYATHASWFPLFYASPNEYVVQHIDEISVDKFIKDAPSTDKFKPVDKPKPVQEQVEVVSEENTNTDETVLENSEVIENQEENIENREESIIQPQDEEAVENSSDTEEIAEKTVTVEKPISEPIIESDHYYIIAGVFAEEANANRMNKSLQDAGFQSKILGKTKTGKWRVAYEGHSDKATAESRLAVIREKQDIHAWILEL